jgi:hypothetical protein
LNRRAATRRYIALALLQLLTADHKLTILHRDGKLIDAEACDGERDTQRASAIALRQGLDIVGRVASIRRLDESRMPTVAPGATEPHPLQERHARHSAKPFHSKRLRHVEASLGPFRRPWQNTTAQARRGAWPLNRLAYGENGERIQELGAAAAGHKGRAPPS